MGSWFRRKHFSYRWKGYVLQEVSRFSPQNNSFRTFPSKSIYLLVWSTSYWEKKRLHYKKNYRKACALGIRPALKYLPLLRDLEWANIIALPRRTLYSFSCILAVFQVTYLLLGLFQVTECLVPIQGSLFIFSSRQSRE